jgi:F-type H+-transporting ATPase subunit gamma
VLFVVCAGDRGLAGAYNSSVVRMAEREIQALRSSGGDYRLLAVGRKVQSYFRFRGYQLDAVYTGFTDNPGYDDARTIARRVRELFDSGEIDQVELVYTEFVSLGTQHPVVRRFLPLEPTRVMATAGGGRPDALASFSFEPSASGVLEDLLPRYVEARLFTALLDAAASEHANRQRAMKAATDNAEELIVKIARQMNRARQDAITTEIMEIVSGAEALSQGGAGEDDLLPDHLSTGYLFPKHLSEHEHLPRPHHAEPAPS